MAQRGDIALGDEVQDQITGLQGVVVCISEWLAGCQRISIQPREVHDGKPVDIQTFDVEQLDLVKAAPRKELAWTGGPHPGPTRSVAPR
jgi:hypothetical protein